LAPPDGAGPNENNISMHDAQFLGCTEDSAVVAIVQNTFAHKENVDHDSVDTFVVDVAGETFALVVFAEEIFAVPALSSTFLVVAA